MPTDHVKNRTFSETLSGTVRFKIPFFQRGYAWERKQWDQLFLDLQEQIIDEIERGSLIDQVEHFFGPIVVMEQTGTPELKEFLVIELYRFGHGQMCRAPLLTPGGSCLAHVRGSDRDLSRFT